MNKYLLLFSISFLIRFQLLFAQTGPGGVGNADGTADQPQNVIWLVGDSVNTSGSDVTQWNDISGNGADFVVSTAESGVAPEVGPSLNGFGTVNFVNGERNRMVILNYADMPRVNISTYIVYRNNVGNQAIISFANDSQNNEFLLFNSDNLSTFVNGSSTASGLDLSQTSFQLLSNRWQSSGGTLEVGRNGDDTFSGTLATGTTIDQGGSNALVLGSEQDNVNGGFDVSQDFDGEMAEVIMFDAFLNAAQNRIIENYLAAKYDITLIGSADVYAGDTPGNGDRDFDVIGIGVLGSDVHLAAEAAGLSFTATSGALDDGDFVLAGHNVMVNTIATDSLGTGLQGRWLRSWYLDKAGTLNSTVDIGFDFGDGIGGQFPQDSVNYELIRLTGSSYEIVPAISKTISSDRIIFEVNDAILIDGIYSIGTENSTASPLDGSNNRTWYSFKSGNWEDPSNWTLDGSVAPLFVNPSNEIPGPIDDVVITNGRTIRMLDLPGTNSLVGISTNSITVEGTLDMEQSFNINFNQISGSGTIRFFRQPSSLDNFPNGDATNFADQATGGTAEIVTKVNNQAIVLNDGLFNNLIININTGGANRVDIGGNITINGNLTIQQGQLRFGNNTTSRTVTVNGDIIVNPAGNVVTATSNARHQLNLFGDFINNGSAFFTNRTSQVTGSEATNGIVDVNFLNNSSDQNIQCNGVCRFYRIEIDKGVDDTYVLNIDASSAANFNLFGFANEGHGSTPQLTDNNNALGLLRGTVRLGPNVNVDFLNSGGNYNISEAARLWVDGGRVGKTAGAAIVPYGVLQVSAGSVEALVTSGVTLRDNGTIIVEGSGVLYANQIRTSVLGAGNEGGYVQTGGTTIVNGGTGVGSGDITGGDTGTNTDYTVFHLTFPGNVFQMTGGELRIEQANSKGGVFINSDPGNQNVTGGQVIFETGNTQTFRVASRAPFWDLELINPAGSVDNDTLYQTITLEEIITGNGSPAADEPTLAAQPLRVLTDLVIGTDVRLDHLGEDVEIGRNFTIQREGQYFFGSSDLLPESRPNTGGGNDIPSSHQNTTRFNGTEPAIISLQNLGFEFTNVGSNTLPLVANTNLSNEQLFYNVEVDKPGGVRVFLEAPNKAFNGNNSNALRTANGGTFSVLSGTFDQGERSLRFFGNVVNLDTLGIYVPGTTDTDALIKWRPEPFTLTTQEGSVFGNVRLNNGPNIVDVNTDLVVLRLQYNNGRINLGTNNLRINELDMQLGGAADFGGCNGCGSVEDMFITAGNASDGGLTLLVPASGNNPGVIAGNAYLDGLSDNDFLFPLGIGTTGDPATSKYTPALLSISSVGDVGPDGEAFITINPVQGELQTTDLAGGDILDFYWRVRVEGFDINPTVDFVQFTGINDDVPNSGNIVTEGFEPGFVLDGNPFTRNLDGGTANITTLADTDRPSQDYDILFDGGTTPTPFQLNSSNFTAGDNGRFIGSPTVYFSRRADNEPGFFTIDWDNGDSWSLIDHEGSAAGDFPGVGDIAIIGFGNVNQPGDPDTDESQTHRLALPSGTTTVAQVEFASEPTANAKNVRLARINIAANETLNASIIRGLGEFNLITNGTDIGQIITDDLGDFANEPNSSIIYNMGSNTPPGNLFTITAFDEYPTVRFFANSANDSDPKTNRFTFDRDVFAQNFLIDGNAAFLVTSNITVGDSLFLGANRDGELVFDNGATAYTFSTEDILFESSLFGSGAQSENRNRILVEPGGGNNIEHILRVSGNITMRTGSSQPDAGAQFDLFNEATASDNDVILELTGSSDNSFVRSTTAVPDLYRVVLDKGSDTSSVFTFEDDIDLLGPTNGASKALELQNGLLVLNDPAINIDLTTGGDDFQIPSSAGLEIAAGEANVNGDDTGIFLDGTLRVSGGTLDMSSGPGNGNNYIEYSASGNALLEITAGTLNVGSQIRRGLSSTTGILNYTQTGGDVSVGINAAPETNRGVLEILNAGSNLTLTGGTLTLVRQNGVNPSVAALRLSPTTFDVTGSTINVFNGSTPANQTSFGINSTIPLNNLVIAGNGNSPSARIFVNPLVVNGTLTVDADGTFRGNGLDLAINGGFNINGTYLGEGNNTSFTTNSTQTLNAPGTAEFFNLLKSGTGTLSVVDDITIENFLNISQGTLDDLGNTITLQGDMEISGTHASTGSDPLNDRGLVFESTSTQFITTGGTGTKNLGLFTINNSNGVSILDGALPVQFNNGLRLESGRFDIGGNLVITAPGVPIEAVNPFSVNNMIRTNNSIADQGLRRDFNAISSATTLEFPVGEQNTTGEFIFTPITFNITDSDDGTLRVRPLNEIHPSIVDDDESTQSGGADPDIDDFNNVLQYHWIIRPTGITDLTGTATFQYEQSDVLFTAPYDETNYTVARLSNTSDTWDRAFDETTVDENLNLITYTFTNEDDISISGDYTAGVNSDGMGNNIFGAIPDNVPTLNTNGTGGGNFSAPSTWQGGVAPTGGEILNVVGTDNLVFDQTGSRALRITIAPDASVTVNPDVFGIRLGVVSGPGDLRLSNEVLPAGDYDDFFNCSSPNAGGLEYFGTTDYAILAGISEVRNVTVTGSGTRTMPNSALQVCESMIINGPDVVKSTSPNVQIDDDFELQSGSFDVSTNTTINVDGNFTLTTGTFDGANNLNLNIGGNLNRSTATATLTGTNITLNGSTLQNITGDWSGANAIDDLTLNNGAGFDIGTNNTVQINGLLTFTDGIISTSNTDSLVLSNTGLVIGGSTASYVNGPLSKENIAPSGSFRFPVGKVGRYREVEVFEDASTGGSNWTAEYFTVNTRGTSDFNTTSSTFGTLTTISDEMWTVTGTGGTSPINAQVQLTWGPESGVVDPADIRIVFWDDKDNGPGADDEWFNIGEGLQSGASAMMGSIRSEITGGVGFSSNDFTLGSVDPIALPVELVEFTANVVDGRVVLDWVTATEIDNSHFEIERAGTDRVFEYIGEVEGNGNSTELIEYSFTDFTPFSGISFYRLKQVDFDGDFEYSAVVSVEVETGLTMSFYPNPIVDRKLNLQVNGLGPEQSVNYSIVSHTGELVDSGTLNSGEYTLVETQLEFNENLPDGIYILTVEAGGIVEKKRIIVR